MRTIFLGKMCIESVFRRIDSSEIQTASPGLKGQGQVNASVSQEERSLARVNLTKFLNLRGTCGYNRRRLESVGAPLANFVTSFSLNFYGSHTAARTMVRQSR